MDFAARLIDENDAFADVLSGADDTTPVPTCPGWTLRQLLRHVGRGHRWAAQIVGELRTETLDPREVRNGKPPEGEAIAWLRASAHTVVDAVNDVGADVSVWTFIGPRPAAWWIRRRLHEVTVHRADAELAIGTDFQLSAELAVDGITEWLERVESQVGEKAALSDGQSLHLHATDGGEWTLRSSGGALTLDPAHADASVTVSGDATSLLLGVTRRIPADDPRISVSGESQVWRAWLDQTPF